MVSEPDHPDDPAFFQDALARARRENRPVVLDFTASWCAPCQRMLAETFPDPEVARLLDQCEFVKVDTDEHPGLASKYNVVGLPDIRLLAPDGTELRRFRDFQGPTAFARALDDMLMQVARKQTGNELITVAKGEGELREAFNRVHDKVRLVFVLSPT
ncbi:MAG: DUF255 domain-containing protein [Phycisphaerae bacterium]|nr:DUF255 domain-containing protein [Phycisphaerae bacterium]